MGKHEFHQVSRAGKTRVWTIEVDGKYVHTTYGELGGKMQSVTDEGSWKNKGKKNEVTPEEDAQYLARVATLKKTRNGYRPAGEEPLTDIPWDGPLPENLRFYKPQNTLSKGLQKKLENEEALLTRKRDGEMMVLVKWADGSASIVSRTMLTSHHLEVGKHTWNDRFPELISEVERRKDIPPRTILLGDVVSDPVFRDRWSVAQFMKSKTEEALEMLPLFFYCWEIAFWEGDPLIQYTCHSERLELIWDVFGDKWNKTSWVLPVEAREADFVLFSMQAENIVPADASYLQAALAYADHREWEGWVVVDPHKTLGDKALNFRGKTDRPSASGKLKPVHEGDFVALFDPDGTAGVRHGKWGRGKHRGLIGSVTLCQYDSSKNFRYICECGGGIDDAFRAKYSVGDFPMVLQVEYTERTYKSDGDKTNALTYPRVVGVREDKLEHECINERL